MTCVNKINILSIYMRTSTSKFSILNRFQINEYYFVFSDPDLHFKMVGYCFKVWLRCKSCDARAKHV